MKVVPDAVSLARFLMSKDKLFTVRNCHLSAHRIEKRRREPSPLEKPCSQRKVARADRAIRYKAARTPSRRTDSRDKFFDLANLPRRIDTLAFRDHNYVYVTPAEVGQARRVKQDSESRPT
jgi:hypothetical protein